MLYKLVEWNFFSFITDRDSVNQFHFYFFVSLINPTD